MRRVPSSELVLGRLQRCQRQISIRVVFVLVEPLYCPLFRSFVTLAPPHKPQGSRQGSRKGSKSAIRDAEDEGL